jgi:uncharacterized protein involved in outer membrane biogenesis
VHPGQRYPFRIKVPALRGRLARKGLWLSLGLIAVLALALLAAPLLLDLPAVQARLERHLSQATRGQLTWEDLDVRLLPMPRGVLKGVRFEAPAVFSAGAAEIEVRLHLQPLLAGNVEVRELRVLRPAVRVTVPKPDRAQSEGAVDPMAAYRRAMQPVVDALRRFAPDLALSVQDGTLNVSVPGTPSIGQIRLNAEGRSSSQGMTLTATAKGALWEEVKASARLAYADLAAHVTIDAAGLKPQAVLDHYLRGAAAVGIVLPAGHAHAELHTDGRTTLGAKLTADIPELTVTRNGSRVDLLATHADAGLTLRGREVAVTLAAVRLGEVVPRAAGRLRYHTQGEEDAEASIEIPMLDLARLRLIATTLAGDQPLVQRYLSRLRTGQATDVRVNARAPQLFGLVEPNAVEASLEVRRGSMLVPYLEQEVDDIVGTVEWNSGVLHARGVSARLGQTQVADGSVEYRLDGNQLRLTTGYRIDLPQALELAYRFTPPRRRAALDTVRAVRGKADGHLAGVFGGKDWKLDLTVVRSDSLINLRGIPWPASVREGRIRIAPGHVRVDAAGGAVGSSTFKAAGVELDTARPREVRAAHGSASLALPELHAWLRKQEALRERVDALDAVGGHVDVTVNRLRGRLDQLEALDYDVILRPRKIEVRYADLPGPLGIDGGSVHVTPQALRAEGVVAALLDARAEVSGTVRDYRTKAPQVQAALAQGETGGDFMNWAWARAKAPAHLQPKTPFRFAAQSIRWSAQDGIDVKAEAQVSGGPSVTADVAWTRGALDARHVHIKDRESDARLGFAARGRLLVGKFAGVLHVRSLAALLAQSSADHPGRLEGDFAATFNRDMRGRSSAHGRLTGSAIRLDWLLGRPLQIERVDLTADETRLRIAEATMIYAGQKATLRGELRRAASGPVIDAQLDTPGVVIDALLPPRGEEQAPPARKRPEALDPWPLPVEGTLKLRAGFLEYEGRRVEPVVATLTLEPQRARMQASEAALCGIAFPFTLDFGPQGMIGSAQLEAKDQQLEATARCLSQQRLLLSGEFDLRADLRTHGRRPELLRNLRGSIEAQAREGQVMKFGLLGNILSLKSVSSLLKGNVSLSDEGFPYRLITIRGKIEEGRFHVEEGAFDSPALGLAATGSVGLENRDAKLTVLVAPFTRIDQLSRKIPIIGYILGGALTSVAVGVNGDIDDPTVIPLDPRAVTSQLVGIFERTLKLPKKLLEPLQRSPRPEEAAR